MLLAVLMCSTILQSNSNLLLIYAENCRKNANSTCYTVLNVWSNRLFNKGCIDTLKSNASILSDEQMLKNNKVINYYRIIL